MYLVWFGSKSLQVTHKSYPQMQEWGLTLRKNGGKMGKAAWCQAVLCTYQNVFKLWLFSWKPKYFFQHCIKKSLVSRNSFIFAAGIWNKQNTTTRNVCPCGDIQYPGWFWLIILQDMKLLRSVTAGYLGYTWDTGIVLCVLCHGLQWVHLDTDYGL